MDSDDDMEYEMAEKLAFETAALASLRAGDPELAVLNADGTLRCPLCSPSKKKQSYKYHDLLQHATAVAEGIRGPETAGKHSALKIYLESDLVSLAPPLQRAPPVQDYEVLAPRRVAESKLVYPWSVVVYKSANIAHRQTEADVLTYFGKNEIKTHFAEFNPDKVHVVWGPRGHLGFSVLQFGRGFEGLNDALALEKHFVDEDHGPREYERNSASGNLGQGFYGWLAREEDVNGRRKSQDEAVAKYLETSADLKDIRMVGDEIKKIHTLQVKKLAESLVEKDREFMNLKKELEIMQKRAEEDRLQLEESLKRGTWTSACQIL